jgi:hypothetical protein
MDNPEISITLKANEWNVVLHALSKRPYDEVVSLISDIKSQGEAQIKHETEPK